MKNLLTLIAVFSFTCTSVFAQSIYRNYEQQNVIQLETNFISFEEDGFSGILEFPTFDAYLNGEIKIGAKDKIALEIPLHIISYSDNFFGEDQTNTKIGNIALAYQLRSLKSSNFFEFKLRLPTSGIGVIVNSDYTERITTNFNEIWNVETSYLFDNKFGERFYYRIKPGLKLLLFTDSDDNEPELLFDASGLIGYRNDFLDINGGITTTNLITESDLDFSERNLSAFFLTASYTKNNFKPGLILRIPFDEDTFGWSLGVNIAYTFNSKSVTDK